MCAATRRPKKRPRVAADPEMYADLVSNMTSQGGDDLDSDADDQEYDTHEVSVWLVWVTSSYTPLLASLLLCRA